MNPEERELLHRTAELAEENNELLHSIQSYLRWSKVWSFIKILVLIVPFIIGYLYLEPYLGPIGKSIDEIQGLYKSL